MPVLPAEVQWYLSNPNTGTGFTGIGTPGNSLGGYMSTTQIDYATPLDNLFPDITPAQNAAGQVDYQCLFMMNNTASGLTMLDAYVWMPGVYFGTGGTSIAIAVDPIGTVPYASTQQQAQRISYSQQQPGGISSWQSQPVAQASSGCFIGGVPPQYCVAIWIQRTAVNSAPSTQSMMLSCTYTSSP